MLVLLFKIGFHNLFILAIHPPNHMENRSSLATKYANINKCDICYAEYNRQEKQPVIICTMHHTVCRECVRSLEANRKCPFCR